MDPVIFDSKSIHIVCISDTHNDNCRQHVPPGDIFIHAGDFTDEGTDEELQIAFDWLVALPHRVKVIVAGNHDRGLDRAHSKFSEKSLALFTSGKAQTCGIQYIDREIRVVGHYYSDDKTLAPIRVYGNPTQPDFLNSSYAFTYKPYPSAEATASWTTAPTSSGPFDIWVTHSPPKDRLDAINVPGLVGCEVLAHAIAKARPLMCVFGHYHFSWGLERVQWQPGQDGIVQADTLSKSAETNDFDFSEDGNLGRIVPGKETIFVNAAWMTMEKRTVTKRNPPFIVKLSIPPASTDHVS